MYIFLTSYFRNKDFMNSQILYAGRFIPSDAGLLLPVSRMGCEPVVPAANEEWNCYHRI
jgi:hypothetical protein